MLEKIITYLITNLLSWLYAKALERHAKKTSEKIIDQKLEALKEASKDAFNGKPISKDELDRLNNAIANFIRSPNNNGL